MFKYWLLAVRPKTLSLAVVPVLVGTSLAWLQQPQLNWWIVVAALLAAVFIQVGTNLHNDVADFERGADCRDTRLGPPRVTAEGWLTSHQVRIGVWCSFTLALLLGIYLIIQGGWPIFAVGIASIAAGLAYTGGPRPVAYTALGELFVWVFFGLVAVTGSFYLQTGAINGLALVTGSLLGMPAAAVLVVNNYRDLDNDRQVGKNTLAVCWGRQASKIEYTLLMITPFALLPVLSLWGIIGFGWALPLLVLPWALRLVKRFCSETPGPVFNQLLAGTAKLQLGFGLLLCLGVLVFGTTIRPNIMS